MALGRAVKTTEQPTIDSGYGFRAHRQVGGTDLPAPRNDDAARSGDNVRGQLVLDVGDAIAELKLALLEPLDLQLVGAGGVLQGRDCRVEVAMLLLQSRQLVLQLTLLVFIHRYQG